MKQINEAYEFVNQFLDDHAAEIIRPVPPASANAPVKATPRKRGVKTALPPDPASVEPSGGAGAPATPAPVPAPKKRTRKVATAATA